MQVNSKLAEELYKDVGAERLEKAKKIVSERRVEIKKVNYENQNNFEVSAV